MTDGKKSKEIIPMSEESIVKDNEDSNKKGIDDNYRYGHYEAKIPSDLLTPNELEGTQVKDSFEIQIEEENVEHDVTDSKVSQKHTNTYSAKKTVAQGMMDIALITANANQLRYIIEFNQSSSTFYLNLVLITVSLMLQVAIGVSLIFKGRMDLRGESKHQNAKRINNYVVVAVFLVTVINVFIASFTITDPDKKN